MSRLKSFMNIFRSRKIKVIITIIGLISSIVAILNYTNMNIPKLDISYDPQKNLSYIWIQNLGSVPIEKLKLSYSLPCQNIEIPIRYIDLEIPTLTPINGKQPFYIQNLDKIIVNTIESSINNSNYSTICNKDELNWYIPYKKFNQTISFSDYVCDSCSLKLTATSTQLIGIFNNKKEFSYKFNNILHFKTNITCFYGNNIPSQLFDASHLIPPLPNRDDSSIDFNCLEIIYYDIGPEEYNLIGGSRKRVLYTEVTDSGVSIILNLSQRT